MSDEIKELNPEELEDVVGGYRRPKEKSGFFIYKIQKGDNLTRLSNRFGCTIRDIMAWNPKIKNKNLIYAGDYLYIAEYDEG